MQEQLAPAGEDELDILYDRALTLAGDDTLDRDGIVSLLSQGSAADHGSIRDIVELAQGVSRITSGPARCPTPRVPGYEVIELIGRGGMGSVYRARAATPPGAIVALKILPPHLASGSARIRFHREARALARLHHDHIISVHDVVEVDGGALAIVLDMVEGLSLADLINALSRGHTGRNTSTSFQRMAAVRALLAQLSPDALADGYERWIARVGLQIARALSHVHNATLVHRDVKPSNILLRPDGHAMLADFGIASDAMVTAITQTGQMIGTPLYAAPEQLSAAAGTPRDDDQGCDPRTDVYALGATLYHALALRPPHAEPTAAAVLTSIREGLAPPLRSLAPYVPRELEGIVAKAMHPHPRARYQSASELADDLQRFLDRVRVAARPVSRLGLALRVIRRNRRTMAAAIAGIALGVLSVAALSFYLFVAPPLAERQLNRSHLSLLTFDSTLSLYDLMLWDLEYDGPPRVSPAALTDALQGFTIASRLRPFDGGPSLSRDVLLSMRSVAQSQPRPPSIPATLLDAAPATASFIRQWAADRRLPPSWADPQRRPQLLNAMSPADREALGLAAFLGGAPHVTVAAWDSLDLSDRKDPLVDALMGILRLIGGQPARAYPRLRSAHERFPQSSFIALHLAQAAAECGDAAQADMWLAKALSLGDMPPRSRARVSLIVNIYAQRWDAVDQELTAAMGPNPQWTSVTSYQIALALERHGRTEDALLVATSALGTPVISKHARLILDLAQRWWDTTPPAQRRTTLINALTTIPPGPNSIPRLARSWQNILFAAPGCEVWAAPHARSTITPTGAFARLAQAIHLNDEHPPWIFMTPAQVEQRVDEILSALPDVDAPRENHPRSDARHP